MLKCSKWCMDVVGVGGGVWEDCRVCVGVIGL